MPEPLNYGRTPRPRRPFPVRDALIGFALSIVLYAAAQMYLRSIVLANLAARAAARSAATRPATVPTSQP